MILSVLAFLCNPALCRAGHFSWTDISATALPQGTGGDKGGMWLDADGDGRLELLFINHIAPLEFWRQQENSRFVNVIGDSGINPVGRDRHGAACGDYDNDGKADLYITNGAQRGALVGRKSDELFRNTGEMRFQDISDQLNGLNTRGRGRSVSWVDFDNDGLLDVYVSNFETSNVLLRNLGDTFEDHTATAGLGVPGGPSAWSDWDHDGDPDLALGQPLRLYRNDGPAGFTRVGKSRSLRGLFAASLAWGDADGDGDQDLFVGARKGPGRLLINEDGQLRLQADVFSHSPNGEHQAAGAAWGDLDNDGDLDLLQVSVTGISAYENRGELQFLEQPTRLASFGGATVSGNPALGDFDGDGDLDVTINHPDGNVLLRNDTKSGNWLLVSFKGDRSNAMGFGTRVDVSLDGRLLASSQFFGGNGKLTSAGCGPMHIGLDDDEHVDLTVFWPGGKEQRLKNIAPNQSLTIEEADPALP